MSEPVLTIHELSVSVPQRGAARRVVSSVSLTIHAGQTLAVVGESGSGKSLTALSVLRLVPAPLRIDAGEIMFEGKNLLTLREREVRRVRGKRISMIFQEPMSALNPVMTIGEQVAEVLRLHLNLNRSEAEARAAQCFEEVGLTPGVAKLKLYPHELSGGMRQRVMIAMALACEPAVLLADEPTTALDVTIQAQILSLLRELQRSRSMAMMLIAHDLGVVAQHADIVCVMYAGHVVEYADVFALFAQPLHPYTRALLKCRPSLTGGAERLATIEELMQQPDAMRIGDRANELDAWWPAPRDEHMRESMLVEVQPLHWVRCWRTPAAAQRGETMPDVPPRATNHSVVSISASSVA